MNKRLLGVWFLIALVGCTPENGDGPMAVPDSALPVSGCPLDAPVDACGICGGEGPVTWYADVDGDGLGDARSPIRACEAPAALFPALARSAAQRAAAEEAAPAADDAEMAEAEEEAAAEVLEAEAVVEEAAAEEEAMEEEEEEEEGEGEEEEAAWKIGSGAILSWA